MTRHFGSGSPEFGGMRVALPPLTPVVKRLLLANVGVFLALFFVGWLSPGAEGASLRWLGLAPPLWREAFPLLPIWQLLTYGFLHGGIGHLFWNMLQLYFFGTMLEGEIGSRRFLSFYAAAVLLGGVAQLVASLVSGQGGYAIGASGGVLGVVVAAAVLQPRALVFLLFIPITLKWLAIAVVAMDVFSMLDGLKRGVADGVAHWAHLGGAAFGFLAARLRWIYLDPLARLRARKAIAREDRRQSDEERMDELLEKIHREGIGSLTRSERSFLERVSSRK